MFSCLSIYLSVRKSIYLCIYQSIYLFIYQSTYPSLSIYPFSTHYLSIHFSTHLYLSIYHLSIHHSSHLSASQATILAIYLSSTLSINEMHSSATGAESVSYVVAPSSGQKVRLRGSDAPWAGYVQVKFWPLTSDLQRWWSKTWGHVDLFVFLIVFLFRIHRMNEFICVSSKAKLTSCWWVCLPVDLGFRIRRNNWVHLSLSLTNISYKRSLNIYFLNLLWQ